MRVSRSVCYAGLILGIAAVPYLIVAGADSKTLEFDQVGPSAAEEPSSPTPAPTVEQSTALLGMPLSFEANQGQVGSETSYLARGSGYRVFVSSRAMTLALGSVPPGAQDAFIASRRNPGSNGLVTLSFEGADPASRLEPLNRLPGIVNYLVGSDPDAWVVGVPTYSGLAYRGLYPGVDLYVWGDRRRMNYEFYVEASADHEQLAVDLAGVGQTETDADGDLIAHASGRIVRFTAPTITEQAEESVRIVGGRYEVIEGSWLTIVPDELAPEASLVIRGSIVVEGEFEPGSWEELDGAVRIATDAEGSLFVTGRIRVPQADSTPAAQPAARARSGRADTRGGRVIEEGSEPLIRQMPADLGDAFVAKLAPDGSTLLYATYFGAEGDDTPLDIAVTDDGQAVIVGSTDSQSFPSADRERSNSARGLDAFAIRLDASGAALLGAELFGGSGADVARAVALDPAGAIWLAGRTDSPDLPVSVPAPQPAPGGGADGFLIRLDEGPEAAHFATYLGGANEDAANAIAIDATGRVIVAGVTRSADFPVVDPIQEMFAGESDGFVVMFDLENSEMVYSTYLGGLADDSVTALAIDGSGAAYVAGATSSLEFPLIDPIQAAHGDTVSGEASDAFVAKIDPSGALSSTRRLSGGWVLTVRATSQSTSKDASWSSGSPVRRTFPRPTLASPG